VPCRFALVYVFVPEISPPLTIQSGLAMGKLYPVDRYNMGQRTGFSTAEKPFAVNMKIPSKYMDKGDAEGFRVMYELGLNALNQVLVVTIINIIGNFTGLLQV